MRRFRPCFATGSGTDPVAGADKKVPAGQQQPGGEPQEIWICLALADLTDPFL
jgi:hypothetical protein